ncbi:hypothetical protein OU426_14205 [Frigidibacter sp. RF13]|nr:hypothetical protein [Frigidibacter sp. RF13]
MQHMKLSIASRHQGESNMSALGWLRIAVPTWSLRSTAFRHQNADGGLSREELQSLFRKDLRAPVLMPRKGKAD